MELQMTLTQWAAVSNMPLSVAGELAVGMLLHRQTGVAQDAPPTLGTMAQAGRVPSGTVAALYALVGAKEQALEWLQASLLDRSWVDQYFRVNPAYDVLRGDPEFERILQELGA